MISWIQITFEKHTKVFLAFLLIVITIPFVFTIGASPGIGGAERRIYEQEFFGYNLANDGIRRAIARDASLSIGLNFGQFLPVDSPDVFSFAKARVASLHLAETHRISAPTAAQLEAFVKTLGLFKDDKGEFDAKRYTDFADGIKSGSVYTTADARRVMEADFRIHRVQALLGGPGYALPATIANAVSLQSTRWTVRLAEFDLSTFKPAITLNEDALATFFEQNVARYEIRPEASVDYVVFPATDYLTSEPLNDTDVVAFFEANKARFPKPSADPAKPSVEPATLAEVRLQVEIAMRMQLASRSAARAASDFTIALYEGQIPKDSPDIDAVVKRFRGQRASAPKFTDQAPPAGLNWTRAIVTEAFRRTNEQFFSDPLPLGSDHLVLLWKSTAEARKPLLAEVRQLVAEDFARVETRRLAAEAGRQWRNALQSRIAAGATLEAALASLGAAAKSEVKAFGPFTLAQPPEGLSRSVAASLQRTESGLSEFLLEGNTGIIVQIVERRLPEIDPASPAYAEQKTGIASLSSNSIQSLVIGELVTAEEKRSELPVE